MSDTKPTLLVAEDEPELLSLVSRHLQRRGFSVVEAGDGKSAWDLALKVKPALAILDVMMPEMSGWELSKAIRAKLKNTAVIMLTGIGETLNEATSPLFQADAWINKPFSFDELDAKVDAVLKTVAGRVKKSVKKVAKKVKAAAATVKKAAKKSVKAKTPKAKAVKKVVKKAPKKALKAAGKKASSAAKTKRPAPPKRKGK